MQPRLRGRAAVSCLLAGALLIAACGGNAATAVPATLAATVAPTSAATPMQSAAPSPAVTPAPPSATPARASATPAAPSATPAASGAASPSAAASPSPAASASAASSAAAAGSVTIGDASAVEPLSRAVGAVVQAAAPGVQIAFQPGEDFSAFCAGTLDAYGAARKIDAKKDAAACVKNSVEFLELKVAINATAVVSTVADQGIGCLALLDLYALFGPESTGLTDWKDISSLAQTVGSDSQFDPLALTVAGPAASSPSSQLLIAKAIAAVAAQRGQQATLRSDYTVTADDPSLIAALSGVPSGAIGWTGLPDVLANSTALRAVRVDGGDGCVDADASHIDSGAYPLSQPLYLYVNADSANTNPALGAFVDAYLSDDTQTSIVGSLGYVPVNPGDLDDARFAWENH